MAAWGRKFVTDPAFGSTSCAVDEHARLFQMWRGDLLVVVNFGDAEVTIDLDEPGELLFETGSGVLVDDGTATIPAHAGAMIAADASVSRWPVS